MAVEQSVATPIEQEVNGVDGMIYMKSSNTSDGRMQLDVNFKVGTDQDMANVLTQNRVSSAQARLPQEVMQQGVTVKKQSPSILMVISLYSPKGTYDANFLINYCGINMRDQLLRIPGIAQVDLFGGTDYGMRIWLRPDRLAQARADARRRDRRDQGAEPAGAGRPDRRRARRPKDQEFTYTVSAPGRLVTPDEFENIIIRETEDGRAGPHQGHRPRRARRRRTTTRSAGWTASPRARWPSTCCPAPTSSRRPRGIYETMRTREDALPDRHGLQDRLRHDARRSRRRSSRSSTRSSRPSILVTLVVFIFLQNLRATIIPLLTVPVSLLGTFIFFPMLGFSVNTLSMFGLVLAIGIVVDDAIVVVEAVMHHIEHGMSPERRHRSRR